LQESSGKTVVTVVGSVDSMSVEDFAAALAEASTIDRAIVLDVRYAPHMASGCVKVIESAAAATAPVGPLQVVGLQPLVRTMLLVSGLAYRFRIDEHGDTMLLSPRHRP